MPLAFDTESHGKIAFGFFNIESDMLLLEHYFFFADEFCRRISELAAQSGEDRYDTKWNIYDIENPADIGDLMGAIHGIRHTGFIGETYLKYPFPERQEDFKQSPEGYKTQAEFREMIEKYGAEKDIQFVADPATEEISIGEYVFTVEAFHELINYVFVGGMPRYKNETIPGYVSEMVENARESKFWLLKNLRF